MQCKFRSKTATGKPGMRCTHPGNTPGAARGYCVKHYSQWKRGKLGQPTREHVIIDSEQVVFRLEHADREKVLAWTRQHGLTEAAFYRGAVKYLLTRGVGK